MKSIKVAFFLAGKAISRSNWGLNVLIIFMLILVYVNLIFTPSLLEGVILKANSKQIETQTGNITVESETPGEGISLASELTEQIRGINGVAGATGTRSLPAEIARDSEKTTVEITGINPASYGDVFTTPNSVIEGEFLQPGDKDQIVLGAQVAGTGKKNQLELYSDSLKNVHAGDKVTVTYPGNVKKTYTVKGIVYNEFVQADLKSFISDSEFNTVYPGSKTEQISVKTKPGVSEQGVIDQINELRSGLKFRTWHERAGFLLSFTDSLEIVNRILRIVALFVAGITIFIVTYVDLVNKRRQIGIERAIGINSQAIILAYVFRAIVYTTIGAILGAVVFTTAIVPIEARYPFNFPFGDVLLSVNPRFMLSNAIILVVVGIVSALLPAWRSMRLSIIEAIWGN